MNVMQQSSKAHDRSLEDWFVYIEKGMVQLPRFQHTEARECGRVKRAMPPIAWLTRAEVQWTRKTEPAGA